MRKSNTLKVLGRVLTNPKKFAREWRRVQERLAEAKGQMAELQERLESIRTRPPSSTESYRYNIDAFSRYDRIIRVIGWAELLSNGADIYVTLGNTAASTTRVDRQDLLPVYGLDSCYWGFDAIFEFDSRESARLACTDVLRLKSKNGVITIRQVAANFGYVHSAVGHEIEAKFFNELRNYTSPKVLELGSRARSGIVRRELFGDAEYTGLDIIPGENVDLVGDAHELSRLVSNKFDFVFSVSVFEHLLMPWKVAVELAKCMNDGGLVFVHTHNAWPVHDAPWDFWRFSTDAWNAIFNRYTGFEIVSTAYKDPCNYVTLFDDGAMPTDHGLYKGYYNVVCLARKICEPSVDWPISPKDVTSTMYPQ